MTEALRIADMTLDSWRAVVDLWVEAWSETMPDIDFEARRDWLIGRRAIYSRDGTRVRVASATLSGDVRGVITVRPRDGYVDQLAVAVKWWGSDVAAALIADARRLSPRGLWLNVNQANERAIAFYEKSGFVRGDAAHNPDSGLPVWSYRWQP